MRENRASRSLGACTSALAANSPSRRMRRRRCRESCDSGRRRRAEDVIVARHRRAVEATISRCVPPSPGRRWRTNANTLSSRLSDFEPAKSFPRVLAGVQLRILAIQPIERTIPGLQLAMMRMLQRAPGEILVVAPLVPLAELAAHEHQLLAGMRQSCSRSAGDSSRSLRHSSPGILSSSERLPCTTSSCDSGRMKCSENAYTNENVIRL